jgi:hypothetical protein
MTDSIVSSAIIGPHLGFRPISSAPQNGFVGSSLDEPAAACRQRKERDDRPDLLAMVIAGDYERPSRPPSPKPTKSNHDEGNCRLELAGFCLFAN